MAVAATVLVSPGSQALKHSTAYTRTFVMVDSTTGLGKTGATVTVNISKAGAAFGAAAGSVAEVANGVYKVSLTSADTGTLGDLMYYCTATGADNTYLCDQVVAYDPTDAVRLGLTAMPNANAGASGGILISGANAGTVTFSEG